MDAAEHSGCALEQSHPAYSAVDLSALSGGYLPPSYLVDGHVTCTDPSLLSREQPDSAPPDLATAAVDNRAAEMTQRKRDYSVFLACCLCYFFSACAQGRPTQVLQHAASVHHADDGVVAYPASHYDIEGLARHGNRGEGREGGKNIETSAARAVQDCGATSAVHLFPHDVSRMLYYLVPGRAEEIVLGVACHLLMLFGRMCKHHHEHHHEDCLELLLLQRVETQEHPCAAHKDLPAVFFMVSVSGPVLAPDLPHRACNTAGTVRETEYTLMYTALKILFYAVDTDTNRLISGYPNTLSALENTKETAYLAAKQCRPTRSQ